MTYITVKSLAAEINMSVDYLLKQFTAVGFNKNEFDYITEQEKESLLIYINNENMNNKFTLQRKTRSRLNITNSNGKSKFVQIEIRKKRTYIQDKENLKNNEFIVDRNVEKLKSNNNEKIILDNKSKNILPIINNEINKNVYFEKELIEDKKNNLYKSSSYKKDKYDISFKKNEFEYKNRVNSIKKEKNIFYNLNLDNEEIYYRDSSIIKNKKINKKNINLLHSFKKPIKIINRDVVIVGETITVYELSNKMAVKASQVIKSLMNIGVIATINHVIDKETAQLVAEDMGHKVIIKSENKIEESVISYCNNKNNYINAELRAPIVTIMGHVDHGKTSLLDYIRLTKVAINEEGGITQHICAYHVEINENKNMITFIDTPGHAAFKDMRIRGAMITDIIVLVVAADDGVMPQTIEAIKHARAAKVPVVVAINKIDKKEANPINVKNELLKYDLIPEEWGGQNQFVNISAKSGEGIENLLDAILLQAEILELKAIRNGIASGIVIESCLDKSRGPLAIVLVYEGTLKCGDVVLCGLEYGRVRAMRDELGKNIFYAGPSIPVEILGLSGIPIAGDTLTVVNDEKKAREVAIYRKNKYREVKLESKKNIYNIENIFNKKNKEEKLLQLNIVFKTDVQGTSEAISNALKELSKEEEVKINIIGFGVGSITETDAMLAAASNAMLIGFNVSTENSAIRLIELEKIDIRYYSVIYDLLNEIKIIMNNKLIPEYKEEIIGKAEVKNIFNLSKFGIIAGCIMIEGIAKRNKKIRILRKNNIIYDGELESLRRFKEDINEINNGMECGIGIKNYNDINIGDIIEIWDINKKKLKM